MKKVIFISALAIAAAVSCTKSDIVDTKFNEAISFETYTGRAAQTKATVIDNSNIVKEEIGLYGFYTGAKPWKIGAQESTEGAIADPTPNLWADKYLKYENSAWTPEGIKYWTNATDYYSFLAYAPKATDANGLTATTTANPTVTYAVDTDLTKQVDLLYAAPIFNAQRGDVDKPAAVALTMKHALSRIAIKANEKHPDYTYTITALSITGDFVKSNTFSLVNSTWNEETETTETETNPYNFTVENQAVESDTYVECTGDEYLMVIPTTVNDAVLSVTYTSTYGTVTSAPITKTVEVSQEFKQGCAYTINLTFEPNDDEAIKFTVTVEDWKDEAGTANKETTVTPDPENPEEA